MKKLLAILAVALIVLPIQVSAQSWALVAYECYESNTGDFTTGLGITRDLNKVLGVGVSGEVVGEESAGLDFWLTPITTGGIEISVYLSGGYEFSEDWYRAEGGKFTWKATPGLNVFAAYRHEDTYGDGTMNNEVYYVGFEAPFSMPF